MKAIGQALFVVALLVSTVGHTKEVALDLGKVVGLANYDAQDVSEPLFLINHGTFMHKDTETITALHRALFDRGLSVLSITQTLGISQRKETYNCERNVHRVDHREAAFEIKSWVSWAKEQGHKNIFLLGHSRGGNQVLRALKNDVVVKGIVLLAPAHQQSFENGRETFEKMISLETDAFWKDIENKDKQGEGETLADAKGFLYCPTGVPTIRALAGSYLDDGLYDTHKLVSELKIPSLVIAGSEDTIVPNLEVVFQPIDNDVEFEMIEGANHFFLDFYADDAADLILEFVNKHH